MFGSQLINKNSSTPYTDATQVSPDPPAIRRNEVKRWNVLYDDVFFIVTENGKGFYRC
jgi:hypothetical protein